MGGDGTLGKLTFNSASLTGNIQECTGVFTNYYKLFGKKVSNQSDTLQQFKKTSRKYKNPGKTWLVWLSGLSAILQTERLLVRFPVRAHAWVAGQVPGWGYGRGN